MPSKTQSWCSFDVEEIVRVFGTDLEKGFDESEIVKGKKRYGKNVLTEDKRTTIFDLIIKQFKSPLVFILVLAGLATLVLGEYLDTIVIFVVVFINIAVGVFQEERATRAFEKLKQSQHTVATVIRGGRKFVLPAEDLVPGDVVLVQGGHSVPADLRLTETHNLSVNEAALTGEWVAVSKEVGIVPSGTPVTGQFNMTWMGTLVSTGDGRGIVIGTGNKTQIGIIGKLVSQAKEHLTPLQENIRRIARFLVYGIGAAILVIFALGVFRGEGIGEMFLISIAIAVAAMPAGLPAAVTIVLALGMEAVLKKGGLVRNLLAAETLGATTIILTDKTGTLTEAKMRLSTVHTLLSSLGKNADADEKDVLTMAVLASDAFLEEGVDAPKKLTVHGRPLEKAIVLAGLEKGISQDELAKANPRLDFMQFESERRYGASLNKHNSGKGRFYITGTPELLLEKAVKVHKAGKDIILTRADRELLEKIFKARSGEGMRLLGVAYKDTTKKAFPGTTSEGENFMLENIVFGGFLAFHDPVRTDVKDAITEVRKAGAQVVMVTGDNPETARSIAREVGIAKVGSRTLIGADVEKMNDKELYQALQKTAVFARVLPTQKLRIARVLKDTDEVVAMTGDGVNDAPALKSAHIGVAVGSGTAVARESADLVLLNNSFAIIVSAIEEGRKVIDNLKKIVAYLLSTGFSEIIVIGGALVAGAPLPLLPAQILWTNIVEEGFMTFPFAFEKKERGIMRRDPRSSRAKNILTPQVKKLIITISIITGVFLLALYFVLLKLGMPIEKIRTIMFVALSLDSIFFSFSFKSLTVPVWKINVLSNLYLVGALSLSILLLIAAITLPPLQTLLSLESLSAGMLLFLLGVGLLNLVTIETAKYFLFERRLRK